MDGKDFYCLKFRSMHVNKDADRLQATKNDPRKFPFGNFMRKANIDELPQMEGRVKRDIWYMEHWSVWLDIRIIWLTIKTIFVHDKNAY